MNRPDVAVIITTFNRDHLLKEALWYLHQNLYYSGRIRYVVGADGEMPAEDVFSAYSDVNIVPGPNQGFGANLNNILRSISEDIVFQTCEDINLMQPLNFDSHVNRLMEDETSGWIRLMWIGSHKYVAKLEGEYWRVAWDSPELYIPSCRPHIKHRRFHDFYGLYPEGTSSGGMEEGFCHLCIDKYNENHSGPDVLVPLIGVLPDEAWVHTGVGVDDVA